MIVGKNIKSEIVKKRSKDTIEFAMKVLKESEISKYINAVYLYGSCARIEEKE